MDLMVVLGFVDTGVSGKYHSHSLARIYENSLCETGSPVHRVHFVLFEHLRLLIEGKYLRVFINAMKSVDS